MLSAARSHSGSLQQAAPPWPVFDEERLRAMLVKVFCEHAPGNKQRQQLLEYAAVMDCEPLAQALREELGYSSPKEFAHMRPGILSKYYGVYARPLCRSPLVGDTGAAPMRRDGRARVRSYGVSLSQVRG